MLCNNSASYKSFTVCGIVVAVILLEYIATMLRCFSKNIVCFTVLVLMIIETVLWLPKGGTIVALCLFVNLLQDTYVFSYYNKVVFFTQQVIALNFHMEIQHFKTLNINSGWILATA